MDRAVLYMKLYTFGMPFMNCTTRKLFTLNNIKKFSDKSEEEHLSGQFFI